MSPRRFAASQGRQDANAGDICKALRRCGASVIDLHAVGGGVPDILVGYRTSEGPTMLLMEIKTLTGTTRDSQDIFMRAWKGRPVVVVRSVAQALTAIGIRLDT